jgi:DNA topoisomerase VI subunit B
MSSRPVRTYFPVTKLAEAVARSGGVYRDQAVAAAMESLEEMRAQGEAEIAVIMGDIETIVKRAGRVGIDETDMRKILHHGDQLVTLAGTFGFESLDKVMRSMCDVADGLLRAELTDAAPIIVHAQSMRLMAPGGAALSPIEIEHILAELAKIKKHYNFGTFGTDDTAEPA